MTNFFIMTKRKPLEENVLYTAKVLYEHIQGNIHIDELFDKYAKQQNKKLSLNLERVLYLSVTFLFSAGKISFKNNYIKRV